MPPRRKSDQPSEAEPPSKLYKFIGNKAGYSTRKQLYDAVSDAQTKGTAKYWRFVNVVEDEAKDAVLLQCIFCQTKFHAVIPQTP
jgi:hypothetical protein